MDTITKYLIEVKVMRCMDWDVMDIANTKEEAETKVQEIINRGIFKVAEYSEIELPKKDQDRFEYAISYILQYGDIVIDDYGSCQDIFKLHIPWGDWKHSHAAIDYVMSLFGFSSLYEEVTAEDGNDAYSAYHYYKSAQ